MTTNFATRFLGCCQICENEQKLHNGKLVHHGYKRPGWGEIVGDCYGVDAVPYEVSCELVKEYMGIVQSQLDNSKEYLRQLKAGEVTHFLVHRRVGGSWSNKTELIDFAVGVTEMWSFKREIDGRIQETGWKIEQLGREVKRLEARIANWKPAATRTVEERVAEEKAVKDARAAERASARQARADKAAATKAKQDALQAKREAIMNDFRTKFTTLAESAESLEGRKAEALKLVQEMSKKKYSFFYARELKCDEAFITLGLATREQSGWVAYRSGL